MIPAKLQSGMDFKTSTVKKINEIIDYLKTQRLSGDLKTIKITQNTSGISISALPQMASGKGGKGESLDFPFKLSIFSEQETKFLSIQSGRVQINDNVQNRCYVQGYEKLTLASLKEAGEYAVMLLINYHPLYDGGTLNPIFTPCVYFTNSSNQTNQIPCSRGVFTVPLGSIKIEENEETGELTYTVKNSMIGNFVITYTGMKHPFSIFAKAKNLQDGTLKNDWSLSDFSYFVSAGKVKIGDQLILSPETNLNISDDKTVYCQVNENEKTAVIITGNDESFYDAENKIYNYPVGKILNNQGLFIQQEINSLIYGSGDTYKVKVNNEDSSPDFLQGKFEFQGNEETEFPSKSYIGAEFPESQNEETGSVSYKIKPYFMYNLIQGYDKSKKQTLKTASGNLKWSEDQELKVVGSLSNYIEIYENEDQKELRWKNQYGVAEGVYYYVMQDQNNCFTIFTYGKDGNKKQGVLTWDFSAGKQDLIEPPAATEDIKNYVLTGTAEKGLSWGKYVDLEDIYKVKVNESDNFAGFLQDKIISEFNTIIIDSFDVPNPENESETGYILTLDINPDTFTSSDKSISIEETEDNQIDFKTEGKVKVNKDDGFAGYLQDKIISEYNTILIDSIEIPNPENESETGLILTVDVNPEKFISSDKSIIIEVDKDDNLDFKSNGKVKCTENDDPDFLNQKINVDESISDFIELDKQDHQILIKSKLEGSGIMVLENGKVKTIPAPESNSVLVCENGVFAWKQYSTCENACKDQESSSSSESSN